MASISVHFINLGCYVLGTLCMLCTTASMLAVDIINNENNPNEAIDFNNGQQSEKSNLNRFWFECNYYSIESNYFRQLNSTFLLSPGSQLQYKCTLTIDVRECASVDAINQHSAFAADTKLIPLNCQDVQIVLQTPKSLSQFPVGYSQTVRESAIQEPYCNGYSKYVAWFNISKFAPPHQGVYKFQFYASLVDEPIFEHDLVLIQINNTNSIDKSQLKNQQNDFPRVLSGEIPKTVAKINNSVHLSHKFKLVVALWAILLMLISFFSVGYLLTRS